MVPLPELSLHLLLRVTLAGNCTDEVIHMYAHFHVTDVMITDSTLKVRCDEAFEVAAPS